MTDRDVVEILRALESCASRVWIDGGWGVDALVGRQTRDHSDLDLAVDHDLLAHVEHVLGEIGLSHDPTIEPGLPARLVLRSADGRQADVHPLSFDAEGNGWQKLSPTGRGWGHYPAEHLGATGEIAGLKVRCISPELQVRFRMGYEWTERDEHDIGLLAETYPEMPLPPPFWHETNAAS
jgi:lincosamide nucleotidyltransferase A/C/D/E